MRELLDLGASLDDVDIVGNTPLLYAVYGGHKAIVEDLLRRGRSLREKNNKNHTVILQAACGGHVELVRWLLDQGFALTETDHDGNTALLFAGTPRSARFRSGRAILLLFLSRGHTIFTLVLVQISPRHAPTVLVARELTHILVLSIPLFVAWGGHLDLMQFLLSRGSSLHEKNHNGHSVFLSAANGGRVEIVAWLLSQGFSLAETNNNGDTALLLACQSQCRRSDMEGPAHVVPC